MALLIAADVTLASAAVWDPLRIDEVAYTCAVLNVVAYCMQTWDAVALHFRVWPVTALNWCAQLSAIALASQLVGVALAEPHFTDRTVLLVTATARVIAQCLYTASQFSVTLEFLARAAQATVRPRPVAASTAVRVQSAPRMRRP